MGPLALEYDWTGWTELTIIDTPVTKGVPPPQSAAAKREAKEMSGEVENDDLQADKAQV